MDYIKVTPRMERAYCAWEPPADVEMKIARVLGLLRAAFYSGWQARQDAMKPLKKMPEGWFLYGLGESVKPITYKGDKHENTGEGYWCELQHRDGGKLTKATGGTPGEAVLACIALVRKGN